MILRVSALLTLFTLILTLPVLATDINVPEKGNQEDSLKNSNTKPILDLEDLEFMDDQEYVYEESMLSEDLAETTETGEDSESPVSFNVFYYLLEKFKFSNSTTSE